MNELSRLWKNYNLGIVLMILFLVSWFFQYQVQWQVFVQEQQDHNQVADPASFQPEFWSATLENWQSEFLQLFSMVVLTSFLIHKGSSESRDSNDKMQAQLSRIENMLKKKR